MPVIASGETSSPASRRLRTQSKPFSTGERAQPGAPRTGTCADPAEKQEIARIDRHAEMLDLAAGRPIAAGMTSSISVIADAPKTIRRPTCPAGDSRLCATGSATIDLAVSERRPASIARQRGFIVGDPRLGDERRPRRPQPLLEHAPRLVHGRRLEARQGRGDEPDPERPPRRDRGARPARPPRPPRRPRAGDREGNDLDRRDHPARLDRREFRRASPR